MKPIPVLIIDEHQITSIGYKYCLEVAVKNNIIPKLEIQTAKSIKIALRVWESRSYKDYQRPIIFLDPKIKSSQREKVLTGLDIGLRMRKEKPETCIILHTGWTNNYLLYTYFKKLNPDSIVIKEDLQENDLISIIQTVLSNASFYSFGFARIIRKQFAHDFEFNRFDREILYLISKGVHVNSLSKHIPLSFSAIEKHIRQIRFKLGIESKDLKLLISAAKENWLI